jgi:sulfatase maturation enzyme AslB (radical SAM superfamily)
MVNKLLHDRKLPSHPCCSKQKLLVKLDEGSCSLWLKMDAPSARVMMCDISPCGGGRRYMAVAANGNAYPCGEFIGMESFVGGNIFTDNVENIVSSDNFRKVTQRTGG